MAKRFANDNVRTFASRVTEESSLIGIEPSAILSFRDEYPALVDRSLKSDAATLANHVYTVEEFLYNEVQKGKIVSTMFTGKPRNIKLHGHCHQKALSDLNQVAWLLSLPSGYTVEIIPSGCCGMAGSFGYETEHYEVSMQIGELVLFPTIRATSDSDIIAASGTSCRHQIKDGVDRDAQHPISILFDALIKGRA